jgi:hypothetical protein
MSPRRKRGLASLLRRTQKDPFFVSHALAGYKSMLSIDDADLMALLRCTPEGLDRLALCRLPDDRDIRFADQVRQISTFVSCDAERLLKLLREVAAVGSLRDDREGVTATGLLMAARDRKEDTRTRTRIVQKLKGKKPRWTPKTGH